MRCDGPPWFLIWNPAPTSERRNVHSLRKCVIEGCPCKSSPLPRPTPVLLPFQSLCIQTSHVYSHPHRALHFVAGPLSLSLLTAVPRSRLATPSCPPQASRPWSRVIYPASLQDALPLAGACPAPLHGPQALPGGTRSRPGLSWLVTRAGLALWAGTLPGGLSAPDRPVGVWLSTLASVQLEVLRPHTQSYSSHKVGGGGGWGPLHLLPTSRGYQFAQA